jgi:cation:H+ antiporter
VSILHFDFDGLSPWLNGAIVAVTITAIAVGAHWVVESAGALAKRLGVSELVIGLTVVAFATSAPEFAVTLLAAFQGHADISVANIVGSNIFNLGFILGGCAAVVPIRTSTTLVRRDGGLLLLTTAMLGGLIAWDLHLGRYDGAILFTILLVYLAYLIKNRHALEGEEGVEIKRSVGADIALLVLGLVFIIVGSHIMVNAASSLARSFGVSEWVIGVTIVAAGTSAPEMATSLVGVLRGRFALSAGSVIGSDLFNMLGVLGIAGMVRPVAITEEARLSLLSLIGMVALVVVFLRTGYRVARWEGIVLMLIAAIRWGFDFSTGG